MQTASEAGRGERLLITRRHKPHLRQIDLEIGKEPDAKYVVVRGSVCHYIIGLIIEPKHFDELCFRLDQ